jgi:mannitol/fructose-specific phosphotransferase system IIA component
MGTEQRLSEKQKIMNRFADSFVGKQIPDGVNWEEIDRIDLQIRTAATKQELVSLLRKYESLLKPGT